MLKRSARFVLASFRPLTLKGSFSEIGSAVGVFSFAKIHLEERTAYTKCGSYLLGSSLSHPRSPCFQGIDRSISLNLYTFLIRSESSRYRALRRFGSTLSVIIRFSVLCRAFEGRAI